jgi:hypothetical protein
VRREIKHLDEIMARELTLLKLGAPEKFIEHLRADEPELTEEEAEQRRAELAEDLRIGRIGFESTAEREVASMFLGLNQTAAHLMTKCDWTVVKLPADARLCLPSTTSAPRMSGSTAPQLRSSQCRIPADSSGFQRPMKQALERGKAPLIGAFPVNRAEADDGARTRDPWLGKPMLYQLSYVRRLRGF